MAPNELAEKLEASADATDNRFDAAEMRSAAALIRSLSERVEKLEGASAELEYVVTRVLLPTYMLRNPMPANLETALAKVRAALERK